MGRVYNIVVLGCRCNNNTYRWIFIR